MFYSAQILAKKGPLGAIWIASHLDRKLKRQDVYGADLESAVETIIHPEAPLALRLSGQLLLGAARIYAKKVAFLYQDCTAVLASVRRAFHKASAAAAIDLPEAQRGGHSQAITLPEHNLGELLTLDMGPASLELLDPEEFATQAAIGPWGHKDSLSGGAELSSGALAGGRASALGASRLSTPGVEVERLRAAATPGTPARSLGGLGFGDDQLLPGGDLVGDMGELPDITGKTPASKRGSLAPATPSRPPGTPSQGEGGLFPVDDDLMPPESPGFGAADDVILDDGGFGDDGVDDDDGGRGRSPTPEAAPAPAPAAPAPRARPQRAAAVAAGRKRMRDDGQRTRLARPRKATAPDGTLVPGGRGPAKRRRGGDADAAAAMLRDPAALLAMPATVGGGVASPLAAFMSQVAEEAWRRPRGGPAAEEGEEDEEGPRAESPAAEAELPVFDDGGGGVMEEGGFGDDGGWGDAGGPAHVPESPDSGGGVFDLHDALGGEAEGAPTGPGGSESTDPASGASFSRAFTKRTWRVVRFLRTTFAAQPPDAPVRLGGVLAGKTRADAARMFYEVLALHSAGYVALQQESAYGEVDIRARPRLHANAAPNDAVAA